MEKDIYNISHEKTGVHMLIAREIKKNSRVLDIGCARGYLGAYLIKEKNCEVIGVEPDKNRADLAEKSGYKKVYTQLIEDALKGLEGEKFDYIICADVLEHLVAPEQVLLELKKMLSPRGRIVISIPNIAHYSVRTKLLLGDFTMQDFGILDRTHLHFYTLSSFRDLLKQVHIKEVSVRPRGDLERWFRKIFLERIGKSLLYIAPELFAVQFIFVCENYEKDSIYTG